MSETVQFLPVSPASPRPAPKRVVAPSSPAVSNAEAKAPPTQVDTPQPVEPSVAVRSDTSLAITRDEAANTFVYRSIDRKSGDIVWQYPTEQVLRIAHRLRELEGLDTHKIDEKI